MPYLPYEEPGITVILSLASFLLLLNGVRYALDRLLYCGIIGEILIGVVWGLPVGDTAWLTQGIQEAIQALGYLGLISLVFEGGLSTDLALLRKSAYMSVAIATVGLLMPIALSFILLVMPFPTTAGNTYPTALAAFSAGASLCSTSLGTTFAIISSANLQKTRVGVVLIGAAMMDDVVGLVMVNIVTTLGSGSTRGWAIARPIVSSFGLFLVVLGLLTFVLRPARAWINATPRGDPGGSISQNVLLINFRKISTNLAHHLPNINLLLSTLVLIALVTVSSFINASVLFSAFLAGGVVNYLAGSTNSTDSISDEAPSELYRHYYKQASIGFSIPITEMFAGSIIWKGISYALLMAIAKGCVSSVVYLEYWMGALPSMQLASPNCRDKENHACRVRDREMALNTSMEPQSTPAPSTRNEMTINKPPHSIALLIGFSMVARGEIGFLIASLSQSSGILTYILTNDPATQPANQDIFQVISWAVILCTITGPLGVGLIVRQLKQQDTQRIWLLGQD